MLGSSRTIMQAGQTTSCYEADFTPYGGERIITNTCPQNYKFEAMERDTETNDRPAVCQVSGQRRTAGTAVG